jgi:hypothetical protein
LADSHAILFLHLGQQFGHPSRRLLHQAQVFFLLLEFGKWSSDTLRGQLQGTWCQYADQQLRRRPRRR